MKFRQALNSGKVLILDGAMGSQLGLRGLQGKCDVNLTDPDEVLRIHQEYFRRGCHAAIANSLCLNGIYLASHGLSVDGDAANWAAVQIARRATPADRFVLGNLGPSGKTLLLPDFTIEEDPGAATEEMLTETFEQQARILAGAGADGLIIETMFDLREAVLALCACKKASDLPVLVSMNFDTDEKGGRTIMGNSARQCAELLTAKGADAVGANCGSVLPGQMARIIAELRAGTKLPILAEPNAGLPERTPDRTEYKMDPATFASGVLECHRAGANVLGGCCGTTPDHIEALIELLRREGIGLLDLGAS